MAWTQSSELGLRCPGNIYLVRTCWCMVTQPRGAQHSWLKPVMADTRLATQLALCRTGAPGSEPLQGVLVSQAALAGASRGRRRPVHQGLFLAGGRAHPFHCLGEVYPHHALCQRRLFLGKSGRSAPGTSAPGTAAGASHRIAHMRVHMQEAGEEPGGPGAMWLWQGQLWRGQDVHAAQIRGARFPSSGETKQGRGFPEAAPQTKHPVCP